jgi:hypothetical protein
MTALAAFTLAFFGFAALALSMHRHHRDVFGAPPTRARSLALRIAGWVLLGLSLAPCIAQAGWAVGIVRWLGLLTAAALAIVLILTLMPSANRPARTRRDPVS